MNVNRADLLYALPHDVARATVLPGAEAWAEPLRAAGIELDGDGAPELVVAPASALDAALATGAPTLLLDGRASRRKLARAGYAAARFLPMPSLDQPSLLLPLDDARGARYGLERLSAPPTRVKQLRNRALAQAIALGAPLPGTVTLAARGGGPPRLVAAGVRLGLPAGMSWVLAPGRASERAVFHLFDPGAKLPSWVLKFDRGPVERIEPPTDEEGLRLVAEVGGGAAEHATKLLGVGELDGRPFVIESAAVGAQLVNVLRTPLQPARRAALVDAIAAWIVELGSASLTDADPAREPFGADSARELAPQFGADAEALLARLDGVPSLLEHGDVGLEHVITDGERFVVIDWERAQRHGLPLQDLAFFLVQALPTLDGEFDDPAIGTERAFARLLAGEAPSSPVLFRWLERACEAWRLPPDAVAPLLSLVWLRLAAVDVRRHFAEIWFSDPALGPQWRAWRS